MADSENTRTVPDGTTTSAETPTVHQDIGTVIREATDILSTVQSGISALLVAAADNGGDFANVVHWMAQKISEDIDIAFGLVETAHNASRTASVVVPDEAKLANATAAAERLRAFAARSDARMPHVVAQEAIDGAVADAIFVLAKALRWGTFEPVIIGLQRAGIAAQGA